MPGNDLQVKTLYDVDGGVAGYVAGFAADLEALDSTGWSVGQRPASALETLRDGMVGLVQQYRQEAEELGVDVNGNVFSTDISSQVKYVGILVYATMDKSYTGTWKTQNNGFVTLDAMGVVVMCVFVMAYIQVCFAWEQYVFAQIAAATTVEQLQAIDLHAGRPEGKLPGNVVSTLQATIGAMGAGALQGTSLVVSGTATANRLNGGSEMPTVSAGDGAGTTAIVSLATGSTDTAGQISIVAGGSITADSGTMIVTVAFAEAYASAPFVTISAANLAAGSVACTPFVTASTTGFTLSVSNNEGLSATTHLFNYMVVS